MNNLLICNKIWISWVERKPKKFYRSGKAWVHRRGTRVPAFYWFTLGRIQFMWLTKHHFTDERPFEFFRVLKRQDKNEY